MRKLDPVGCAEGPGRVFFPHMVKSALPWLERGAKAGILVILLFTFSPPMTEIGFIIILVCASARAVLLKDVSWRMTYLDYIIAFFFFVMILSSVFSIAPLHSLTQIKLLRFFALSYAVRYLEPEEKFTRWALVGFVVSLSILSLYSVSQYVLGRGVIPWFYGKLQWEGRVQPGIGQLALCSIVVCVALLGWGRFSGRYRALLAGSFVLIAGAIYCSFARSVWLAFAASGITLGWIMDRRIGIGILAVLIGAVGIFLAMPHTRVGGLLYSMRAPLDPKNPRYGSNMERVRMVRETTDIVKKRPILGVGFDAYRFYTRSPLKRISSDYLQFLANTGLLGLLAYLALLGCALRTTMSKLSLAPVMGERARVRREREGMMAITLGALGILVAFIVCGAFEPMFFGTRTMRLLPFFIGLSIYPSPLVGEGKGEGAI